MGRNYIFEKNKNSILKFKESIYKNGFHFTKLLIKQIHNRSIVIYVTFDKYMKNEQLFSDIINVVFKSVNDKIKKNIVLEVYFFKMRV